MQSSPARQGKNWLGLFNTQHELWLKPSPAWTLFLDATGSSKIHNPTMKVQQPLSHMETTDSKDTRRGGLVVGSLAS